MIVHQPENPDEAWAWAVRRAPGEDPLDAGYDATLEGARSSAERAALGASSGGARRSP